MGNKKNRNYECTWVDRIRRGTDFGGAMKGWLNGEQEEQVL